MAVCFLILTKYFIMRLNRGCACNWIYLFIPATRDEPFGDIARNRFQGAVCRGGVRQGYRRQDSHSFLGFIMLFDMNSVSPNCSLACCYSASSFIPSHDSCKLDNLYLIRLFGCRVEDTEISVTLEKSLAKQGIQVFTNTKLFEGFLFLAFDDNAYALIADIRFQSGNSVNRSMRPIIISCNLDTY
jgi:hypothetical protein